ncbi:MAG TPA: O-antigen ligase family protein, partial [Burkholderiales bacterium]|nr:O-antigen ligase family protein [Burkholderiales bacterium]
METGADMVSERFVGAIGIAGGSVFLAVLPFGRVTALRSVALGLALVVALWLWLARGPRSVPLLPAFGVWLAAALLSLVATHNMAASLDAIYSEVVRSFAVFFVFYVLTARLPAYRAWVAASALGFGLLSTLAVVSFFQHGAWVFYYAPLLGEFATLAVTVLPLLAGYLAFARDDRRLALLCGVGLVAALIAGYLTYSRAFWLALTCGLVVAVAIHSARAAQLGRRAVLVVALVCSVGAALAAVVAAERGLELTAMDTRWPIYSAVLNKLPHNPLTGTGYGHETDKHWYERALPGTSVFHP